MIPTPYRFEANLSDDEFKKLGQFAPQWSRIDHTIGNCLRRLLDMTPKHASVIVFPLSMDHRMARIGQLSKLAPFTEYRQSLFDELKPIIKAMQFLRTTRRTLIGTTYTLADRPPIPDFLPNECRALPKEDNARLRSPPKSSPG
jgi:hypothetical protein